MDQDQAQVLDLTKETMNLTTKKHNNSTESEPDYEWVIKMARGVEHTPLALSYDIDEDSLYQVCEQLLKSHAFSCLGAMLYLNKSFIIWCDYDIESIKIPYISDLA